MTTNHSFQQHCFHPNYADVLLPIFFPLLMTAMLSDWPIPIDFSSVGFWIFIGFFALFSMLAISFFPKIIITDQAIIFKGLFGLPISKHFNFCDIQQVEISDPVQSSRGLEINSKKGFSPIISESNYAGFDQIIALLKLHVDITTVQPTPQKAAPFKVDVWLWPLVFFLAVLGGVLVLINWLG